MSITFIAVWLIVGIVADLLCMWVLCVQESHAVRELRRKLRDKHGLVHASAPHTYHISDMVLETPWWAHLIMIVIPPTAILRMAM